MMFSSQEPSASRAPASVELRGIRKSFGNVLALDSVSLNIRGGEFFTLLGPSGCGKTTLLRIVAGLEIPENGAVHLAGADATALPAHKRSVNTVFQSYALFPHLNVWENVAFGLKMRRVPKAEIQTRVRRVMETMQISELERRMPEQLSGGQKQRVALARAIVNEPSVLLLDEPLGALDLKLRRQLQIELHNLQRRLGVTFVYVTHDQEEALVMSDRLAVMNAGQIVQLGPPEEIYETPRNRFVAQFIGSCNLLDGTVSVADASNFELQTLNGALRVELPPGSKVPASGTKGTVIIRPEKIQLTQGESANTGNNIGGTVRETIYTGAETQYVVDCGSAAFQVTALNTRAGQRHYSVGQKLTLHLPPSELRLLDD